MACHDSRIDRIADNGHDNRNLCCRLFGGEGCGSPLRYDDVDFALDQVRSEGREILVLGLGPPILNSDVMSLDVPVVSKS